MSLGPSNVDAARPCADPQCPGQAEPEQDGDHRFYECVECGYIFGFERVQLTAIDSDGNVCALGVPETLRRQASAGMNDLAPVRVPLTLGRRPHATP